MDRNSKNFYAKVAKYGGLQQVRAARVHEIFADVLKPESMGFTLAKRGHWARQVSLDIFHVIRMDVLKGKACGLSYGLSLSYVPYPYVPRVKWHKTLKSVSLDLREQPQIHMLDSARAAGGSDDLVASTMLGEKCLADELESIWKFCSPKIAAWFDSTHDLPGVLAKCDDHLSRRRFGEIQYLPDENLVRAFTYAKLARLDEARADLEVFLREHEDATRTNLYAALEMVNSQ